MDLVQDDEPILRVVERGLRQTVAVVAVFEVEVERVPPAADLQGQRGLANLSRADQRDRGLALQGAFNVAGDGEGFHNVRVRMSVTPSSRRERRRRLEPR